MSIADIPEPRPLVTGDETARVATNTPAVAAAFISMALFALSVFALKTTVGLDAGLWVLVVFGAIGLFAGLAGGVTSLVTGSVLVLLLAHIVGANGADDPLVSAAVGGLLCFATLIAGDVAANLRRRAHADPTVLQGFVGLHAVTGIVGTGLAVIAALVARDTFITAAFIPAAILAIAGVLLVVAIFLARR